MLNSVTCRQEHFRTKWYEDWSRLMRLQPPAGLNFHRKNWEFCAIAQALHERGMLRDGKRGIGFAVGKEKLVSLIASCGPIIIATDISEDDPSSEIWKNSNQFATGLDGLHYSEIVTRDVFDRRVSFQRADMRDLSALPSAQFDFLWSSCAFEHLGSLEAGTNFVKEAMRLLKPGGIAVHTTEINVSSNTDTITSGAALIYRRREIEQLDFDLRAQGMCLEQLDFFPGSELHDRQCDEAPYYTSGREHIKLRMGGYVCTSQLVIAYR